MVVDEIYMSGFLPKVKCVLLNVTFFVLLHFAQRYICDVVICDALLLILRFSYSLSSVNQRQY
jgi:hypothetical protein